MVRLEPIIVITKESNFLVNEMWGSSKPASAFQVFTANLGVPVANLNAPVRVKPSYFNKSIKVTIT
jgi:hypothetical protein